MNLCKGFRVVDTLARSLAVWNKTVRTVVFKLLYAQFYLKHSLECRIRTAISFKHERDRDYDLLGDNLASKLVHTF